MTQTCDCKPGVDDQYIFHVYNSHINIDKCPTVKVQTNSTSVELAMDAGSSVTILRADIAKQIGLQLEASKNEHLHLMVLN